jgi:hypothetical protein
MELTDDPEEFDLLVDITYEYSWRVTQYPFLLDTPASLPKFIGVRVSLFSPPFVPDEYQRLHIEDLHRSNWPFRPVMDHLMGLFFEINPLVMSKICYDAMGIAGRVMFMSGSQEEEIGFDTVFPLILISVIACGLTQDPRILPFVAQSAIHHPFDSYCQVGGSYCEAILKHILELDESDLAKQSMDLDKAELSQ